MKITDSLKHTIKSKHKIKALVIFLAVLCLVQGSIIYYLLRPEPTTSNNIEDFSSYIHKRFKQNNKKNWDSFDRFFDDDFFNRQSDPFDAMERFHKRMEEMMEGKLREPFNRSWESWFENRFSDNTDEIKIETEEKRDAYIITINTQNLKDNVLNINIDKDGISIKGDFTKIIEKKDSDGTILSRQERRQSITRKFPLPKDANYQKANIEHKTTEIIITLPKNQ
jgi:HSP20 family molecular chaperone IbpA